MAASLYEGQVATSRAHHGRGATTSSSAAVVAPLWLPRAALVSRPPERFDLPEPFQCVRGLERRVFDPRRVQAAALLERILWYGGEEVRQLGLHGYEEPDVVPIPANIRGGFERHLLIGVGAEVHDEWPARDIADPGRDVASHPGEVDLPVVPAHGI